MHGHMLRRGSNQPVACQGGDPHTPVPNINRVCELSHMRVFTSRELQVVFLLGQGKTTKEIARTLQLAPATVSSYRKGICRKLDVHSTAELLQRILMISR